MKTRSRKLKILIPILVVMILASIVPSWPSVLASSTQLVEVDKPPLYATSPDTEWITTFGGSDNGIGYSVKQTTDGGFVVVGTMNSDSFGGGDSDIDIIKTDASGNQIWSMAFGGSSNDEGRSVQQTTDGGFIIAGYTESFGSGSYDMYLIRMDSSGNPIWSETFGGSEEDQGYSVLQATDGGFVIAGHTESFGSGGQDVYLIKTDESGNQQWSKTFGGSGTDYGYSVLQTTDSGFIIAGWTDSFGFGDYDAYLVKTDASGNQLWSKTFGGSDYDNGFSVSQTTDGGFVITGRTESFGDINRDTYMIKTDALGNQQWSKTYGGSDYDTGRSVMQTADGGFVITGGTKSFGAGNFDVYLIKTDALGNQQWSKTFGGSDYDNGNSVLQTADGGFVIAGETLSFGSGDSDVYLIKIAAEVSNPTPSPTATPTTSISSSSSTPPWLIGGIGGGIALVMIMGFIGIDKNLKKKRIFNARVKQLRSQMEKWRSEGYDVSSLEDLFK